MTQLPIGIFASALSANARQAAASARELGFEGLIFDALARSLPLTQLSQTGRREFTHVLASHSQRLIGLSADLGSKGFGPGADVDRLLADADRVLETTAGLMGGQGMPLLCLEVGALPPPPTRASLVTPITQEQAGLLFIPPVLTAVPAPESTTLPAIPPPVDPLFVAQVDAAMAELGALADRYQVFIAMRSELSSFAAVERALLRVNCPWFGVDLDPISMLRDRWNPTEIFSRLGQLIRHVRVRDANIGSEHRTRPAIIGKGDIHWDELLSNLDAVDYGGWLTIDPTDLTDRMGAASSGIAYLRSLA